MLNAQRWTSAIVFITLMLGGISVPFRGTHAASCYDEYKSQKKFTSEECINSTKEESSCAAISSRLLGCSGPEGALGAAVTGDTVALGSILFGPLDEALGAPSCAQLVPYLKYFVGMCQRANPDKFCGELGKGPGGCCFTQREPVSISGGECLAETEQCVDKPPVHYSCCVCEHVADGVSSQKVVATSGQTYESCEASCKKEGWTMYHGLGAGSLTHQSAAPSPQSIARQAMYCFTAAECASEDYKGTFQPGSPGCQNGEGRCIAPEPELTLSFPIGNVTTVKGYRSFVSVVFQYLIGIVGIVAAIAFVWGGFRYIFGSAFENIARAKEIMVDAAIGLILVLSAVAILRTINPATLNLNKLDVFMINKSRVLNKTYCKDIKPSKPIKFAKAGSRPDLIPFGNIKPEDYAVDKDETLCGEDYYAETFEDQTCKGWKCPGGSGICHKCVDANDCTQGTKKGGSVCEKGNFGGNITYSDCRYVNSIHLMYVCASLKLGDPYIFGETIKYPQNKFHEMDYGDAGNRIGDLVNSRDWSSSEKDFNKTSVASTEDTGNQRYLWNITQADLDKAKEYCQQFQGPYKGDPKYSGVEAIVIGIKYQDPGWEFGTAVSGVCGSITTSDEYAIIGKNNCGNSGMLNGYWEGDFGDAVSNTPYKQALWCSVFGGNRVLMMDAGAMKNQNFNYSNVWTFEEIQDAITNEKSIQCDIVLNKDNAFANPLTGKNNVNKGLAWRMKNDVYCPRIR